MNRRWVVGLAAALAAATAGTGQAQAGTLYSGTVRAKSAVAQDCIKRPISAGRGVTTRNVSVPSTGWVTASLAAGSGDWDVAIFDRATRRRVAGSTFFGASERAQGFVAKGDELVVQACHRSGRAGTARLNVTATGVDVPKNPPKLSLVRVSVPTPARKRELASMGLDLTEHGGDGYLEVVLHGEQDARALREAKFAYTTEIADLGLQSFRDRRAEQRPAQSRAQAAALPSGNRTWYRRLDDYNQEMKTLASQNPDLVKPLTLPFKTLTGLSVHGIEITEDATERDGKPVFLQMGIHHAREWPSGEHAMEWAYELIKGYKANNPQVRRLMRTTRTIVIPVVNPEGFNTSREAGERLGFGAGRPNANYPVPDPTGTGLGGHHRHRLLRDHSVRVPAQELPREQPQRRRPRARRLHPGRRRGQHRHFAVRHRPQPQLRRLLGRPGRQRGRSRRPAATSPRTTAATAPFSERETQNVRALVSRPPGHHADHQPHLLQPRSCARRASAPRARRRTRPSTRRWATRWPATTATPARRATSCTTPPAAPRTGPTTRPAAWASRSRSAGWASTRSTRT